MTPEEMLERLMHFAKTDERIRAAALDGSRADKDALHDAYSDIDIVWFVRDVREFTRDRSWISAYGKVLIAQFPDDWYSHPYDYDGRQAYHCLVQYEDGNRIDFTLYDLENAEDAAQNAEPRRILLDKDGFDWLRQVEGNEAYYVRKPSLKEYQDVCNEFRWLSLYVAKGLCRNQFNYARYHLQDGMGGMFLKMVTWKIGTEHAFRVSCGAHEKYLERFLTEEEMARVRAAFPGGDAGKMWEGLFGMMDYFEELARIVAHRLSFPYEEEEAGRVRRFLEERAGIRGK